MDINSSESELENNKFFTLWESGMCDTDSYLESDKYVKILLREREIDHGEKIKTCNHSLCTWAALDPKV